MSADGIGRVPPDRFTDDDVEVLPLTSEEELCADPRSVEGRLAAISAGANTFDHLRRYGMGAYPDGLRRFREQWSRSMSRDLPRLERMERDGELDRLDREIERRLDPSLRRGRETLPGCYATL